MKRTGLFCLKWVATSTKEDILTLNVSDKEIVMQVRPSDGNVAQVESKSSGFLYLATHHPECTVPE